MKKLLFVFVLFVSLSASSQGWNFGFNLGVNHSFIQAPSSLTSIAEVRNDLGFQVGIMGNRRLFPFLHFTPKVEMSLNPSKIDFDSPQLSAYEVMGNSLNVAPHLRVALFPAKRKPYILVGPNLKFPLEKKEGSTEFGSDYDLALDVGVGYERGFVFFNFAPEIRYSVGLRNINKNPVIEELYLHQLTFVINFY